MDNSPPPTNCLSLAHLLLWMAVTGVLFGLYVQELARERKDAATFSAQVTAEVAAHFSRLLRADQVLRGCLLPVEAIAVVSALLWPWRRSQLRGGFPTQPGHWLLLAFGTAYIVDTICQTSIRLLLSSLEQTEVSYEWLAPSSLATIETLLSMVFPVTATSILVASLVYRAKSRLWTATIATLLALMVLDCVGAWINRSQAGLALFMYAGPVAIWTCLAGYHAALLGALLLAWSATRQDRQRHLPRDLFHYAGLVVLAAVIVDRFAAWMIGRLV